ncbi:MAG: DUF3575 domain-containing protein [Polaribacter sp.]
MKKITLLIVLLISTISTAQEKEEKHPQDIDKKGEIKINALTILSFKWIDLSYERLLDEESSLGISAAINTDTSISSLDYSLTPYYRRYFSGKYARGFFAEGFGMLFSAEEDTIFNNTNKSETGFALGVSVGGKFVSKKGFTTELLLGIGRNFADSDNNDVVPRIGISLGYRF